MVEVTVKKRKVSKRSKKSWRKHVDTSDVDKFLDDSRQEERLGPVSSVKDSDLFVVSTKPEILPKKIRREILRSKEPRCFDILKPHTAVPDPISKRNRVRTKEERRSLLVLKKEALRKSQGILKLKEKLSLKNKMIAAEKRSKKPKKYEFNSDIWQENHEHGIDTSWMSSKTVKHTLTQFGFTKKNLPTSLRKKTSGLPVIEPPHPGTSYNPSFDDHQHLLHEVAEKEIKYMKEEKHLERVTTKMFKKVTPEEKEASIMEELSQGLKPENNEDSNDDDDDDDTVLRSINAPAKNVKKTRVQRRKQKEQKKLAHMRQKQKIEKKKIADIYQLRLLNKKLAAKEMKEDILRKKRLKKKVLKEMGTKTLSKLKYEPLEPEFKLAEEITGSLRNSEPTINLLMDRYKSLQQRNIVAPGKMKLKHPKTKVKRFIKADHKIDVAKLAQENLKP